MVNKIIYYFNINNENEAIDYLTKNDNGIWGHPFIPMNNNNIPILDNNINNPNNFINSNLLNRPKTIMNDIFLKVNSFKNENNTNNLTEEVDFKTDKNICDICGESIEFHDSRNIVNDSNIDNSNGSNKDLIQNESSNNNLVQNVNISEEETNICPICLSKFENPIELEVCKHKYCRECFHNYLVELIKINQIDKIPCPLKNCLDKEIKEEFFSKYLSEEEYFKFRTLKSNNEIARDPKKIFCPLCDSYANVPEKMKWQLDTNNLSYKKTTITCQKGHNFCSCGRPLHENDCYHMSKDFKEFLIKENIKQCPKCGFLIKKNKGCNHMTCGNPICKYEFCWLCMKEAVPGHYNYGECKGMQFIEENSFSARFHRSHPILHKIFFINFYNIIVCIIFFGLLILVPSVFAMLVFVIGVCTNPLSLEFKNIIIKFLYALTGCCILLAIQSIFHFLLVLLLGKFITSVFSRLVGIFCDTE